MYVRVLTVIRQKVGSFVREALALNQRMQQVDKITMTREKYGSKGTCAETEDAQGMPVTGIDKVLGFRGTYAETEDATIRHKRNYFACVKSQRHLRRIGGCNTTSTRVGDANNWHGMICTTLTGGSISRGGRRFMRRSILRRKQAMLEQQACTKH